MLDPGLSAAELYNLALQRPDLYPQILSHPNCYPDLANWINSQTVPTQTIPVQTTPEPAVTAPSAPTQTIPVPSMPAPSPDAQSFVPPAEPVPNAVPSVAPVPPIPDYDPQQMTGFTGQPEAQTPKKRRKTGLIVAIILVVALALGGAGFAVWWFWLGKNHSAPAQATSSASVGKTDQKETKSDDKSGQDKSDAANKPDEKPQPDESIKKVDFANFTSKQMTKDNLPEWDMKNASNAHLKNQKGQVVFYPDKTKYLDLNDDGALDAVLYATVCFNTDSSGKSQDRACSPIVRTATWDKEKKVPHFMPLLQVITMRGHLGMSAAEALEEGLKYTKVENNKLIVEVPFVGDTDKSTEANFHVVKIFKGFYYLPDSGTAFPDLVTEAPPFSGTLESASKYKMKAAPFDDAPDVKVKIQQVLPPDQMKGEGASMLNGYRKTMAFVDSKSCLEQMDGWQRAVCYYEVWVK